MMKTIALGLSIFLAFAGPGAGAAEYEVRVLDPLPEGFIRFHGEASAPPAPALFGPNGSGEFGGNAVEVVDGQGLTFAIRWNSDGEVSVLDVPEDVFSSFGYEINKKGNIVGWLGGTPPVAVIWHRDGTRTDLPSLTEDGSAQAYSINNSGAAVGHSNGHPVVWDRRGHITELPVPDGTEFGTAWSISSNGVIFGQVQPFDIELDLITILWCQRGRC
jgi:hypothetical protein